MDETKISKKWHKRAVEQLDKSNKDCNNTAGLQAVLKVAVGACVMLRRDIDPKGGLVNGTIGTILSISDRCISIKFDHANNPCDIEKLKSAFMVIKNYYVYRTQFPLILAYSVTIHKCQGLSLDCAIKDFSRKKFADGMAYVALSRVKSLEGFHLTSFDSHSIWGSLGCTKEINRLRKLHVKQPVSKATRWHRTVAKEHRVWSFKYHCVCEDWQHTIWKSLGVHFKQAVKVGSGRADLPLTNPNMRTIKKVKPNGNCMFRSLSCMVTSSQDQHRAIRLKVVEHMRDIGPHMMKIALLTATAVALIKT